MRERATANDVPFTPLDKLFEPTVPQGPELPAVDTLPVEALRPFSGHPFHLYTDEKLRELTDSIREHGVLMPVLVRPLDGGYEIVSGHNRVEAAKLAGLDKVPVTVRELDDDTATILMVDSNLRQRETLLPSEKAWAYRMKLEAIKRQGFRTDLTSAQVGQKLNRKFSRDLVAEEAGESKNQISRYIPLSGWACCRPRRNRRQKKPWAAGKPVLALAVLFIIAAGCLTVPLLTTRDPAYMDLSHCNAAPCGAFPFGTDSLGRDLFSMIWSGGRLSLFIGIASTLVSTCIAVVVGAASGMAPRRLDALLMRLTEILLSVPGLLLVILLQAVLGETNAVSLSLVIGLTSWTSIAKVVRTEVRQMRNDESVLAARCMGAGFFYVLRRHLAPNFLPSILFMVVMNVRSAMLAESTLSFMGIGLPVEVVTWGSMLSLSEKALLTGSWWTILIPGAFLVATLLCLTSLGQAVRRRADRMQSNL